MRCDCKAFACEAWIFRFAVSAVFEPAEALVEDAAAEPIDAFVGELKG